MDMTSGISSRAKKETEKRAVNVENLIRNENHLEPRQYYDMPRYSGGPGMGKIPQWDGIKDILEVVCKF